MGGNPTHAGREIDVESLLEGRTAFIVGSAKNAGKTTFLNFALGRLRHRGGPERRDDGARGEGPAHRHRGTGVGFLSIGVDGEARDLVFGNPKPRVRAEEGDLLVTTDRMLSASELSCELLEVFPGTTVLGRLALVRVLRGGFVELAGPEHNEALSCALDALHARGARTVLVDGAVDRLTQAASREGAGIVFVVRAERSRLASVQDSMRLLEALARVETAGEGASDAQELPGALTRDKLAAVPEDVRTLVLGDLTKVFLSWREWKAASARREFRFRRRLELLCFCVVLKDLSRAEFERGLEPAVLAKILYNPYEASA